MDSTSNFSSDQGSQSRAFLNQKEYSAKDYKLIDESAIEPNSGNCHLSLQVGLHRLSYCVLDTLRNKYIALESKAIHSISDFATLLPQLNDWINTNTLLQWKYKSVSAAIVHNKSTLVPNALYEKSKERDFVDFNLIADRTDRLGGFQDAMAVTDIASDQLINLEAVNLYMQTGSIEEVLTKSFSQIKIMHYSTTLIEGMLMKYKNQGKKMLLINFHRGAFDLIFLDDNSVKLYNSYTYQTKEDFVYFVLFVCEQLKLNPEKVELMITGELEKKSEYYHLLYTYIRNISFSDRNGTFEYSYVLDELPSQFFYNLFSQYQCVS